MRDFCFFEFGFRWGAGQTSASFAIVARVSSPSFASLVAEVFSRKQRMRDFRLPFSCFPLGFRARISSAASVISRKLAPMNAAQRCATSFRQGCGFSLCICCWTWRPAFRLVRRDTDSFGARFLNLMIRHLRTPAASLLLLR